MVGRVDRPGGGEARLDLALIEGLRAEPRFQAQEAGPARALVFALLDDLLDRREALDHAVLVGGRLRERAVRAAPLGEPHLRLARRRHSQQDRQEDGRAAQGAKRRSTDSRFLPHSRVPFTVSG